jgi:hypothetical protein
MCARLSCTRLILILGGLAGIVLLFTGIFTVPNPPSHTIMPGEPYDKYAASDRDLVINSLGFRLIMGGAATIIVSAILHYRYINRAEELGIAPATPSAPAPAPKSLQPIWNSAVLVAAKPTVRVSDIESAESTAIATVPTTAAMATPKPAAVPVPAAVATPKPVPAAVATPKPVPAAIGPSITSYRLPIYRPNQPSAP